MLSSLAGWVMVLAKAVWNHCFLTRRWTSNHAAHCRRAAAWSLCCPGRLIDKAPATVIGPAVDEMFAS
jgi:hypothetical protein